jgi:surface antigen
MRGVLRLILSAIVLTAISATAYAGFNPFGAAGLPLNKQDYRDIAAASDPLLNDDSVAVGTTRDWNNAKSGNHGTVALLKRYEENVQGANLPCRDLKYIVQIKNQVDPYNLVLTRCKVSDGSWKIY